MSLTGLTKTLAWTDYDKKDSSPQPPLDAFTFTGFKPTGTMKSEKTADNKFKVNPNTLDVEIYFDKTKSWVVTGKEGDKLLKHEQGHYNITAIAGREFHDEALKLTAATEKDLFAAVTKLYQDTHATRSSLHKMYDEDPNCGTDHGVKKDKQSQWDLRITNTLNKADGRLADLTTCPSPPPPP
jgi:hypothetical protein